MPSRYARHVQTHTTPQSRPIPGAGQVPNSAGGYAWQVDHWTGLDRFLVLGTEGGSYYADERKMTQGAATSLRACLAEDAARTVARIVELSTSGRVIKNDAAIFALAVVAAEGAEAARWAALQALPQVCRIGTHLFQFIEAYETLRPAGRKWSRSLRTAVSRWYLDKGPGLAAYQMVKYRQRGGWHQGHVVTLAHPKSPKGSPHNTLFQWAVRAAIQSEGKDPDAKGVALPSAEAIAQIPYLEGFLKAQASGSPTETAALVQAYKLPREAVQPEHLTAEVYAALLGVDMPATAMIRNLGTMTKLGVLTPTSAETAVVIEALTNVEKLKRARVHPVAILAALLTYRAGQGVRSKATWVPVTKIVDALDEAFYGAFQAVKPTGQSYLLALDVSGSMGGGIVGGVPGLTPRLASAAMALVTLAVEPRCEVVGFTSGSRSRRGEDGITPLPISARQRLDDVVKTISDLDFGGTDCALPMLYGMAMQRDIDAFVIYTDSETWAGNPHPSQALAQYRAKQGKPRAKLATVGMVANEFSIADPRDPGMCDFVGFDTGTPQAIAAFAAL